MYTIKQASALTGVPADTLRAWERRYSVPTTTRSEGGYRLYDDRALDTLRRMRTLIEGGHAAAQAAEAVKGGDAGEAFWSPSEFVAAVIEGPLGDDELSGQVLLAMESSPLAVAIDEWLMPMLRLLGDAWADGRITPAEEHIVSAAVIRRLSTIYEHLPAPRPGAPVLVGLPAGSRHEIGALAFALLLRRAGHPTAYLGQDVPVAAWLHAVTAHAPSAVVLAVLGEPATGLSETFGALREANPDLPLYLGGPFAGDLPAGVTRLPASFADAVAIFGP